MLTIFNQSFRIFERRKPPKSVCSPHAIVTGRYFGILCVSDAGLVTRFDLLQMAAIRKLSTVLHLSHPLRSNVQGYGCKLTKLAPNQAVPKWMALNQTMRSKTKACIAKSWGICALIRYYRVWSGNMTPIFWDNLSVTASGVKKSKRENTARQKLTNTIFNFGTWSITQFLKDTGFRSCSGSSFRQRSF